MSSVVLSRRVADGRRRVPDERSVSRAFIVVIGVLLVILAAQIVFHLAIAPRLVVRHVEIITDGAIGLNDEALLTIADLSESPYYFDIDADAVAARLETYPLIKSATAEKVFPDKLRIRVVGRTPLAVALVEQEGGTVPVAFDEEGVVFQIGSSVEELDIPVVSGLTFPDVRLGRRIARPLTEFLADLERLRRDAPELFNLISEIKFVKKNRSGFEVILFPRDYPVRVRIGTGITEETMKRIVLILDVVARQGVDERIAEIDFRTDEVVMRMKGE